MSVCSRIKSNFRDENIGMGTSIKPEGLMTYLFKKKTKHILL